MPVWRRGVRGQPDTGRSRVQIPVGDLFFAIFYRKKSMSQSYENDMEMT